MPSEIARVGTATRVFLRNNVVLGTAYTNSTVTGSAVLSLFTAAANGVYQVNARLWVTAAAATTGVQLGLTGPTSGVTSSAVRVATAAAAGTEMVSHQLLNDYQAAAAGLTTPTLATITALIQQGSATGTAVVALSARSEVAGSAITVLAGSTVEWTKVL